jgi:gliding motility-associated-like protein
VKKHLYILLFFGFFFSIARSQTDQTVINGGRTIPINFPGTGCAYFWTNDNPSIGLQSNGEGNIPSFTAINKGSDPITATITATPVTGGVAYITNIDRTLSLIDVATNEVKSTLPVTLIPHNISITPGGAWAYITNGDDGMVSVLNTTTNSIEKTIKVGYLPTGIIVSPDGAKVYVVNSGDNTVSIISTSTKTVIRAISLPKFGFASAIAINPDGSKIYIGSSSTTNLAIVNTATYTSTVIALSTIGASYGVEVSPDGSKVYVGAGKVVVLNAATNSIITTIDTGFAPFGIAISSNGLYAYVANANSNTVSVINTATYKVLTNIKVYEQPLGVALSADENTLYVTNFSAKLVSAINTTTNTIIKNINVGLAPRDVKISKAGTGCTPFTITITVNPGKTTTTTGPPSSKITLNNAFTPNGDGINDYWNINNIENYPNCSVVINNRYGNQVYHSLGYSAAWDGKYKKMDLPAGTYYYIIDLKDNNKPITGFVTLIR